MTAPNSFHLTLWGVVEQVLLISHGQESVERGFSITRQVEVENILGETVTAQQIVCDSVGALGGSERVGTLNVDVSSRKKAANFLFIGTT